MIASTDVAESIADSYSWFANEAFWSKECGRDFGRPQQHDDEDPNCNDTTCKDNASSSDGGDGGV